MPTLLITLGESPSAVIDNLYRAERIGLNNSADEWMAMRQLRNLMIHEFVEDLTVLVSAPVYCFTLDATNKNDGFFVESRRKAQQ